MRSCTQYGWPVPQRIHHHLCFIPSFTNRMDWLLDFVPAPHTRLPISLQTLGSNLLPALVCYYATAVLVLIPGNASLYSRFALLPVTLSSCFRACTKLDFAQLFGGHQRFVYFNHGLLLALSTVALRSLVWTFEVEPYYRLKRHRTLVHVDTTTTQSTPTSSPSPPSTPRRSKSEEPAQYLPELRAPLNWRNTLIDALDLSCNLRGLDWNWSDKLYVPPDTRNLECRISFLRSTILWLIQAVCIFDTCHRIIQYLSPQTPGCNFALASGGTIFDSALPPVLRYLKSTLITTFGGVAVIFGITMLYLSFTLWGVGVFGNDPRSWPPAFAAPWYSPSLNEFWSKRWHQSFRDIFIGAGSLPFSYLLGRPGIAIGAFFVSGILHVWGLWGMGQGTEFWSVAGYFLMMGVGILAEHKYKAITGYRVGGHEQGKGFNWLGGWRGHLWTLVWTLGWGNFLVDAWFRKGLAGSQFFVAGFRPTDMPLHLVHLFRKAFHGLNITAILAEASS